MYKRLIGILVLLIVVIVGGGFLLYIRMPTIISSTLSQKLDVKVSLEEVNFNSNSVSLDKFKIKNPPKSSIKTAFEAEKIQIEAPYTKILGNPIIINEISLENVYVSLILSRDHTSACNWNILLNHIGEKKSSWYSIQRTALIKHLILKNITIELQLFGKQPQTLSPIKKFEFFNIDVEKGIPTKEISEIIIQKMVGSIFSLTSIKRILGLPLDALEFFFKPFEGSKSDPNQDPCPMYK